MLSQTKCFDLLRENIPLGTFVGHLMMFVCYAYIKGIVFDPNILLPLQWKYAQSRVVLSRIYEVSCTEFVRYSVKASQSWPCTFKSIHLVASES